MGIGYTELLNMTWKEYDYYSLGHQRRTERQWDYTRHIVAGLFNSSGFAKKPIKAIDVMKLPMLDKPQEFRKVPREVVERLLLIMEKNN